MQQEAVGEQDVQAGQPGPADVSAQGDGTQIQAQMPVQGVPGVEAGQQPAAVAPGGNAAGAQDAVAAGNPFELPDADLIALAGQTEQGRAILKQMKAEKLITADGLFAEGAVRYSDPDTGETRRSQIGRDTFETRMTWHLDELREAMTKPAPSAPITNAATTPTISKQGLPAMRSELQSAGVNTIVVNGKKQAVEKITDATTLRRAVKAQRANQAEQARIADLKRIDDEKKAKRRAAALNRPQVGQFKSNVVYTRDNRVTPVINEINRMGMMNAPQFTKPGKLAGPKKLIDGNYDGIVDEGKVAVPSFMGTFSKAGNFSPDQMLAALSSTGGRGGEAGLLPEGATLDDMWQAIREEVADYRAWKDTGKLPLRARNMDQDQQMETIAAEEANRQAKLDTEYEKADAALQEGLAAGKYFTPQTDVVADGLGEDDETFRIDSAFVDSDAGLYYDLTSNATGKAYKVPVNQVTGLAPVVDDISFDVNNMEAEDEQQDSTGNRTQEGETTGRVPEAGVQPTDGDRGGGDAVQRGEREADAQGAAGEPEGTGGAPEVKPTRAIVPAPRKKADEPAKPSTSLFGGAEPFNLAMDTAKDGARIQAERDAKREQERKAEAAKADMSLLGADTTGTEQAVFYRDAKGERVKVVDLQGWRKWIEQQPGTDNQRKDRLKMFDTLKAIPRGEAKAIAFAAKLAGIEVPKDAEAPKPKARVPQPKKPAAQEPQITDDTEYNDLVRAVESGVKARRALSDIPDAIRSEADGFVASGRQRIASEVVKWLAENGTIGAVDERVARILKAIPLVDARLRENQATGELQRRSGQATQKTPAKSARMASAPFTPVRGMVLQDADGFIGPVVKIEGDTITLAGEGENGVSDLMEYDRNALAFDPQFQMDAEELAKTYPDEFGDDSQQSSPVAAPEAKERGAETPSRIFPRCRTRS